MEGCLESWGRGAAPPILQQHPRALRARVEPAQGQHRCHQSRDSARVPSVATDGRCHPAQGAESPVTGRGWLRLGHTVTDGRGLVPEGVLAGALRVLRQSWVPHGCQRRFPQPQLSPEPPSPAFPGHGQHNRAALCLQHGPGSSHSLGLAKLVSGGRNVSRAGAEPQMRLRPRLAPSFHPRPHLSRRRNWRLSRPRNPAPALIYGCLRGIPAAPRNHRAFAAGRGQRSAPAPPARREELGWLPGAAQGPPGVSRWVGHGSCRCTVGLSGGWGWKSAPKKGYVPAGDTLGRSLCPKDGTGDRQDTASSRDQAQAGGWRHPGGSLCAGRRWPGLPQGERGGHREPQQVQDHILASQTHPMASPEPTPPSRPGKVPAGLMLQRAPGAAQGCLLGKAGAPGSSSCVC